MDSLPSSVDCRLPLRYLILCIKKGKIIGNKTYCPMASITLHSLMQPCMCGLIKLMGQPEYVSVSMYPCICVSELGVSAKSLSDRWNVHEHSMTEAKHTLSLPLAWLWLLLLARLKGKHSTHTAKHIKLATICITTMWTVFSLGK